MDGVARQQDRLQAEQADAEARRKASAKSGPGLRHMFEGSSQDVERLAQLQEDRKKQYADELQRQARGPPVAGGGAFRADPSTRPATSDFGKEPGQVRCGGRGRGPPDQRQGQAGGQGSYPCTAAAARARAARPSPRACGPAPCCCLLPTSGAPGPLAAAHATAQGGPVRPLRTHG